MVEQKKTKRERDIKSKLMAAIAMLLVSSIMMVSTTYAWFTLSTAPEVTGITTAVGANGNLEMALLPNANASTNTTYNTVADALNGITSGANDSMAVQTKPVANVTWGNLVDLDDTSYGMSKIVLYPSQRPTSATSIDYTNILQMPTYGADGRVSGFTGVGNNGIYNAEKDAFYDGGFGVRAVGNVSGMTAREQAYRQALSAAKNATNNAGTAASIALNEGGSVLGTMAIAVKIGGSDATTFTEEQVTALANAFGVLLKEDGAMDQIETAIRESLVAAYVAKAGDDDNFADVSKIIRENDLSTIISEVNKVASDIDLSNFNTMISAYTNSRSKADNAQTKLTELAPEGATWGDIKSYAANLASTENLMLNGKDPSYWMEQENGEYTHAGELINGGGLTVTLSSDNDLSTDDGIYLTIADFTGTVNGSVVLDKVSVGSISVSNVKATMKASTGLTTGVVLTGLYNTLSDDNYYQDGEEGAADANPISDYYGYIVDMAFRTNAQGSNLQLQTEGVDRIYTGNTANEATMGGGSTMTFSANETTIAAGYDLQNVVGLMECIRVIFFNPDDGTIYGYARLDSDPNVLVSGENSFTMPLKMWDPELNENQGGWAASSDILPLDQNKATAVSMLVYLDGNTIDNGDVSTSALVGSMNVQFASDAELTPMEYNDLRNGGAQTPAGDPDETP